MDKKWKKGEVDKRQTKGEVDKMKKGELDKMRKGEVVKIERREKWIKSGRREGRVEKKKKRE